VTGSITLLAPADSRLDNLPDDYPVDGGAAWGGGAEVQGEAGAKTNGF